MDTESKANTYHLMTLIAGLRFKRYYVHWNLTQSHSTQSMQSVAAHAKGLAEAALACAPSKIDDPPMGVTTEQHLQRVEAAAISDILRHEAEVAQLAYKMVWLLPFSCKRHQTKPKPSAWVCRLRIVRHWRCRRRVQCDPVACS
jgi:hypothetical protein